MYNETKNSRYIPTVGTSVFIYIENEQRTHKPFHTIEMEAAKQIVTICASDKTIGSLRIPDNSSAAMDTNKWLIYCMSLLDEHRQDSDENRHDRFIKNSAD